MISETTQYIIVFIILALVIAWLIYKLFSKKEPKGGCCGCALSDNCKSVNKSGTRHSSNNRHSCHNDNATAECKKQDSPT